MPADERRSVTSPSGKRVRIPSASGVLNGLPVDLMNLSRMNVLCIDAQLTGIVNGSLAIFLANGQIGRFEPRPVNRTEDVEAQFVGQPPPTPRRAVA